MSDSVETADKDGLEAGKCPLCESHGAVGTPCHQPICARKGYHFVPGERLGGALDSRRGLDPVIGRRIDGWLAIGVLGAGAFGVVFMVMGDGGTLGALKLIARREDEADKSLSVLKKFRLECEALAALDHPNIVRLLHVGRWDDGPYLVMEYVSGGTTLKRLIDQRRGDGGALQADVVWHILRQLLSALGSAHAPPRRIVHRDIKPENIMILAAEGDPYHVKVLDFGLAKFVEDGTETTQAMGTPAYMAPEQLWKQRIGPWTDLYAVGVVTFELLTGRRPFTGTTEEIVQRKASPGYDVLSEGCDELDGATQTFLRRALAFTPEARFGDADEMARALDVLPPFVGLAAEFGDEVEMDPEKLRLKRMEEQMQAERRKLDDERRRLEQERAQIDSQRIGTAAQFAPPPTTAPTLSGATGGLSSAPQPLPTAGSAGGGSKGGMFLGLAGGVLLVGVLLIVGKAWLSVKADEQTNTGAVTAPDSAPGNPPPEQPGGSPPAQNPVEVPAVEAAPAPVPAPAPAAEDVVAAAPSEVPDAVAAPEPGEADAVAGSAQPGSAEVDAVAVAEADVTAVSPDGSIAIGSSTPEPPKAAAPKAPAVRPAHKAVRPQPAARPEDALGKAFRRSQAELQAKAKAEADKRAQEDARKKAFQEGLGREFKKTIKK